MTNTNPVSFSEPSTASALCSTAKFVVKSMIPVVPVIQEMMRDYQLKRALSEHTPSKELRMEKLQAERVSKKRVQARVLTNGSVIGALVLGVLLLIGISNPFTAGAFAVCALLFLAGLVASYLIHKKMDTVSYDHFSSRLEDLLEPNSITPDLVQFFMETSVATVLQKRTTSELGNKPPGTVEAVGLQEEDSEGLSPEFDVYLVEDSYN